MSDCRRFGPPAACQSVPNNSAAGGERLLRAMQSAMDGRQAGHTWASDQLLRQKYSTLYVPHRKLSFSRDHLQIRPEVNAR